MNRVNLGPFWRWAAWIADLCYPGSCAVCRGDCGGGGPLCQACADQLDAQAAGSACQCCAKPLAQEGAPCPWCLGKGLYPYKKIVRLGVFDDPLKELVYQMKYRGRWSLGETLADWMARQQHTAHLLKGTELLVAVPLHIRRQFSRGYNQAEIVARRLGKQCGIKLVRPVKRVRDTPTQTRLTSQKARHENMRGAFKLVDPDLVRGKHVVVVDDVMTSGATLQAVGRELLRAGPASLCAIILAAADPKRRGFQAI